ncbi:MAG: tyrosine/phenylalanine carboxypeptidase domain-containing protein [Candidatus Gracilibacteria bacterium]
MPSKNVTALDHELFLRFQKEVADIRILSLLESDADYWKNQKQLFLAGKIENPTFLYPFIDKEHLSKTALKLTDFSKSIEESSYHSIIKEIYCNKIEEQQIIISFLNAVSEGNEEKVQILSEKLYGAPERETTMHLMDNLNEFISKKEANHGSEKLLQYLEKSGKEQNPFLPSQECMLWTKNNCYTQFQDALNILQKYKEKDIFTAEEIAAVFEEYRSLIDTKNLYSIVLREKSLDSIAVDHNLKEVVIPTTKTVDFHRLSELLIHELGYHVQQAIKGLNSRIMLLGKGFANFEKVSEGPTTVWEQVFNEDCALLFGIDRYLSIAFTKGMVGKKRNFREIFNFSYDFYFYFELLHGVALETAKQTAVDLAWTRTTRTFRGTSGLSEGFCFTKDMIYTLGNISTWSYYEEYYHNHFPFPDLTIGKYDYTNPNHTKVLQFINSISEY